MARTIDKTILSDAEAKDALRGWPLRPDAQWERPEDGGGWLRARPGPDTGGLDRPAIVVPGMTHGTTIPDGLWVAFGASAMFADLVVVEHCGTRQNFYDKRSRYMAATYSRLLRCPLPWLTTVETVQNEGAKSVWELLGVFNSVPTSDALVPVRHLRVLYALNATDYEEFLLTPFGAHEFFCVHSTLRQWRPEGSSPKFQQFVAGLSTDVHFYSTSV